MAGRSGEPRRVRTPPAVASVTAASVVAALVARRMDSFSLSVAFIPTLGFASSCGQAARGRTPAACLPPRQRSQAALPLRGAGAAAAAALAAAGAARAAGQGRAAGRVARRAAGGAYKGKSVADLKAILKERKLPVSGKKAELVARLEEADAAGGGESAEPEKPAEASPAKAEAKEETKEDKKEPEAAEEHVDPPREEVEDKDAGKPATIVDEDGRTRYLCLDGRYRRGDPDAIKCDAKNFEAWLSEWIVAARTGQLLGKPQKTFLPKEKNNPGNPTGNAETAGPAIDSLDVLKKLEPAADGTPRWEYVGKK